MKIECVVLGIVLIIFGSVFTYEATTISTTERTTGEDITWFIGVLCFVGISIITVGVLILVGWVRGEENERSIL